MFHPRGRGSTATGGRHTPVHGKPHHFLLLRTRRLVTLG